MSDWDSDGSVQDLCPKYANIKYRTAQNKKVIDSSKSIVGLFLTNLEKILLLYNSLAAQI